MIPEPEIVEMRTDDGVLLRARRYPRPGSRPVICAHGLASNGYEFDLPLQGFRISEKLYGMGYEVWILNFRGAGHPPWRSDVKDWLHSGDQLGIFDICSVVKEVRRRTGKAPFYIGHSFGGMALYIYLSGAVFCELPSPHIDFEVKEAEERNASIAGAITIASPLSIPSNDAKLSWSERIQKGHIFQRILLWLEKKIEERVRVSPYLPIGKFSLDFGFRHPFLSTLIMLSPPLMMYLWPPNMGKEACRVFGTWAGGDVSLVQVLQTLRMMREGELRTFTFGSCERLSYSLHSNNITTPLVAVAGGRDFITPRIIERGVLERVSSKRKMFIFLPECGHVDLLYRFPLRESIEWLEESSEG